ncbi:MAG: hypothetical protein GY699_13575 [Desulfobacteraceae bacterium]|nr:hypothetical protein [Desulfobacteraceae bacterium]
MTLFARAVTDRPCIDKAALSDMPNAATLPHCGATGVPEAAGTGLQRVGGYKISGGCGI